MTEENEHPIDFEEIDCFVLGVFQIKTRLFPIGNLHSLHRKVTRKTLRGSDEVMFEWFVSFGLVAAKDAHNIKSPILIGSAKRT